jgi:hypothetical protein
MPLGRDGSRKTGNRNQEIKCAAAAGGLGTGSGR